MALTAELWAPTESFELGDALAAHPEASVAFECVVPAEEGALPLVWVEGPEAAVETARDQAAVASLDRLATDDDRALCHVEWAPAADGIVALLAEAAPTVLEATADRAGCRLVLCFPDEAALEAFRRTCRGRGVAIGVERVYDPDEWYRLHQYRLTESQREALAVALARGYYRIPRDCSLDEVASALGISEQAASERLRRGLHSLLGATLG